MWQPCKRNKVIYRRGDWFWITPQDGAARSVHTNLIHCKRKFIVSLGGFNFLYMAEFEFLFAN